MHFKGRAWVFGRNVNTDLIFPKMWFRPTYEPGEMASHLMVGLDEEFPNKVRRGDIIVGGQNFGCGSSREEAAAAMKEAGIAGSGRTELWPALHAQLHQCWPADHRFTRDR